MRAGTGAAGNDEVEVDLTTEVAGLRLPSPVMTASGCAGTGRELEPYLDPATLGAVVTRSVTLDPRAGAPMPRLVETPSGVLSAVGLQNPGLHGFLATELPWLAQRKVRTVVSLAGSSLAEYAELASRLGSSPGVTAVEVNLAGGTRAAEGTRTADGDGSAGRAGLHATSAPYRAAKVVSVVRRDLDRSIPVLAKVDSGPSTVLDVAEAVLEAGADGLVLAPRPVGLCVDRGTLRPALGSAYGSLSGPAVRPVALACVWQVHAALPEVPLVAAGGVRTGWDALEMMLAGARAVQVGTVVLQDPSAPARIVGELARELSARRIGRLQDVVGHAHRPGGDQT